MASGGEGNGGAGSGVGDGGTKRASVCTSPKFGQAALLDQDRDGIGGSEVVRICGNRGGDNAAAIADTFNCEISPTPSVINNGAIRGRYAVFWIGTHTT